MKYLKTLEEQEIFKEKYLLINLLELCEYTGCLNKSIKILKKLKENCIENYVEIFFGRDNTENTIRNADFTYYFNHFEEGIYLNIYKFHYEHIKLKNININFNFYNVTLTDEIILFIDAKKYNL
jgi:hypothetical protein